MMQGENWLTFFCVCVWFFFFFFFFTVCLFGRVGWGGGLWYGSAGILVPLPGIKPVPCAVEARSLTYWIAREIPKTG